jgi:hypothetical protein
MHIPKHMIDKKKSMQKNKNLNVKWTLKDKKLQQSRHLKLLNVNNTYIRKISMQFINKFFIRYIYII